MNEKQLCRCFKFQFRIFMGLCVRIPIQWNLLCVRVCVCLFVLAHTIFLFDLVAVAHGEIYFIAQKLQSALKHSRIASAICVSVY